MSRRQRFLNPAQLGCQVVLDARFITGVANGAALSSWTGRSGTSVNATQATGINQPTYQAAGLNGGPSVRFDGANDIMTLNATTLFQNVASGNIWAVVRDNNLTGGDASHAVFHFNSGIINGASRAGLYTRLTSASTFLASGRRLDIDSFATSGTIASTGNATILGSVHAWSSGTLAVRVNGVQGTNGNFSSGAGNTSNTASLVVSLADNNTVTNRLQGDIAAAIAVTPSCTDPVCKRIEQSLALSFKIAIS